MVGSARLRRCVSARTRSDDHAPAVGSLLSVGPKRGWGGEPFAAAAFSLASSYCSHTQSFHLKVSAVVVFLYTSHRWYLRCFPRFPCSEINRPQGWQDGLLTIHRDGVCTPEIVQGPHTNPQRSTQK
jgi:hypothetical protein